jgi:hypothetical protein
MRIDKDFQIFEGLISNPTFFLRADKKFRRCKKWCFSVYKAIHSAQPHKRRPVFYVTGEGGGRWRDFLLCDGSKTAREPTSQDNGDGRWGRRCRRSPPRRRDGVPQEDAQL